MHDPWTDRLSEYIDGELTATDTHALERHLEACDVCRATLDELRAVVASARSAQDREPTHDLWPGIAAVIEGAVPLDAHRTDARAAAAARRRFSFSLPQLAAAAVVLMTLSGGVVWLMQPRAGTGQVAQGEIIHTASGTTQLVSTSDAPVRPNPALAGDIAELEDALAASRDELDPATIAVVERSLDAIDRAIADARAALEADPGNPHLHRQLDNTMRKKIALLRRATEPNRAGT